MSNPNGPYNNRTYTVMGLIILAVSVYACATHGYDAMEDEIRAQQFAAKPENRIYGSYDAYKQFVMADERVELTSNQGAKK